MGREQGSAAERNGEALLDAAANAVGRITKGRC
jgi:hypothetical protein